MDKQQASDQTSEPAEPAESETPGLLQTASSVSAAFFGVQSSKNRERDFSKGKASHFIIMGVLLTVVFIGVVLLAVKVALHQAGQ